MTLLLAWTVERSRLEITGLDQGLSETWKKFEHNLGLDVKEGESAMRPADIKIGNTFSLFRDEFPWRSVLDAFLCLMPEDAVLFVDDSEIYETWLDYGLEFSRPAREEWKRFHPDWPKALSGVLFMGVHQGNELVHGKRGSGRRKFSGRLGLERTVLYLARDNGRSG